MYDSVSVPVQDENSALFNSHNDSFERTLSRHKVKTAVAILFVVVVALVGLANTQSQAGSQKTTAAYLEADADVITLGQEVLTTYAIRGVDSQAYITHSSNTWNIDSNIGIFGTKILTTEEQWDLHYFDDKYGQYYKVKHSHDTTHFLTLQGAPYYNPTVLHAPKTIYDKEGFIRWSLSTVADASQNATGVPATGANNVYYLVNVKRGRCLAIVTAVTAPRAANYSTLQNSVTSLAKDGNGNFPSVCRIEFSDAASAPQAGPTHGLWWWW